MAAADSYGRDITQVGPARNAAAVVLDVDFANVSRGIMVGVSGNVSVNMSGTGTAIIFAMTAGNIYPIAVNKVNTTGTTATGIVAIW
jgi:hypothetical protein